MSLRVRLLGAFVIATAFGCTAETAALTPTDPQAGNPDAEPEQPAPCGAERLEYVRKTGVSTVDLAFGNGLLAAAWMTPSRKVVTTLQSQAGGEPQDYVVSDGTNPDGTMPPLGTVRIATARDGSFGTFWSNQAYGIGRSISGIDLEAGTVGLSAPVSLGYLGAGPDFGGPLFDVAASREGFVFAEVYRDTDRYGYPLDRFGGFVVGLTDGKLTRLREFKIEASRTVGPYAWSPGERDSLVFVQSQPAASSSSRWQSGTVSTRSTATETPYTEWTKTESTEKGLWDQLQARHYANGVVVASRYTDGTRSFLELRTYDTMLSSRGDKKRTLPLVNELEKLDVAAAPNDQFAVAMVERASDGTRVLRALRLAADFSVLTDTALPLAASTNARSVAIEATETELHVAAAVLTSPQGDPSKSGASQDVTVTFDNLCDNRPQP